MKALREKRTKEEISQQRKPYDQKYNIKRRLNKEQAAAQSPALIQRQFRKNKQEQENKKEELKIAADILNDIIDVVPKEAAKKKNREAVARHRAKAKGEAGEPPKTRARAKKIN